MRLLERSFDFQERDEDQHSEDNENRKINTLLGLFLLFHISASLNWKYPVPSLPSQATNPL